MAQSLISRVLLPCGALASLLAWTSLHAQTLSDPTRPPQGGGANLSGMESPTTSSRVQSIIIGKGRAEALVDGRVVRPGDRVDGGQVVKISETEVVLNEHGSLHALKLFPGIEKRPFERGEDTASAERKGKVQKK